MSYISRENTDKIALEIFKDLADEQLLQFVQTELMHKLRDHHSIYTTMDMLSNYITCGLINPVDIFYNTYDHYEALMVWKAANGSEFRPSDFAECWDEENPIPGWKKNILSVHPDDIEINRRQDLLKIIPESER